MTCISIIHAIQVLSSISTSTYLDAVLLPDVVDDGKEPTANRFVALHWLIALEAYFRKESTLLGKHSQDMLSPSPPRDLPARPEPLSASGSTSSLPRLPYHVQRTASQGFPVYHLAKRGGNLHQTRIRKIRGDVNVLREQLRTFLHLKKEDAVINQVTGHIILKVRLHLNSTKHGRNLFLWRITLTKGLQSD